MKILFVSQWYKPEPDGRVSALAEGLAKRGNEVLVITGFPNYPKGKIYEGYKISWRQWENIKGVRVLRLPLYPDHSQSILKRSLNYISFSLSIIMMSPWFIKKPDVIWAYTPLMSLATIYLHIIFRAPYVMEIADIWPDTITATGMVKKGYLLSMVEWVANKAYKNAKAITVQNPGFKINLTEKGVNPDKIHIIENWADEEIYKPVKYDKSLAISYEMDGKFNILFAGNMGFAQDLGNIIAAAKLCVDFPDIQFTFIGDGACLEKTINLVKDAKLTNVRFIGRKPAQEMPKFFAIADVLLVHLKDDPLFEITLPSKTQAYLACGRPVLMVKRGADARMLEEEGCAISCEPGNPDALAKAVIKMFQMKKETRDAMGRHGLDLYNKKYKKDTLMEKMEIVLKNLADNNCSVIKNKNST